MSENSQEILCGASIVPPEELDIEENPALIADKAKLESSAVDLIDNIGTPDFKYLYKDMIHDLEKASFQYQRRFINRTLDKIEEVYDYVFPFKFDILDGKDLLDFYEFIQFLEFDNVDFLGRVWKSLNVDIYKIDIFKFCENNIRKIINECENELVSFDFSEKINLFLRTYNKEGFVQWFGKNSEASKVEIKIIQIS